MPTVPMHMPAVAPVNRQLVGSGPRNTPKKEMFFLPVTLKGKI